MDSLLSEQLASSGIIRSSFARRIAESIELRAIKEADAVLTMCPALTNYVKSKFPSKAVEHILDFPYYAEESKVLPEEAALVKSELGCIQKPIFMYVGNFRQCQGVELMIQGFIEGVVKPGEKGSLVVVGGDSKRLSYFRKNTREQGLSNRIIFTGQKAPELVRVYLENSWALLSPRLYGLNTPMKVYEYLGAGKPIIATRIPAHSQILNDDTVIFVDPSVTSLAAGFRILLRNHQHANVLCEKSLTTFRKLRETHSKQRAIEIIQRIYSGAITKQHQHLHGSPQRQQLDNAPEIY
jgi:glycosyltransferase involved in cell wall biosynthesis